MDENIKKYALHVKFYKPYGKYILYLIVADDIEKAVLQWYINILL